jgi:hypothetical protein
MKKLSILIILLVSSVLSAQDRYPDPLEFIYEVNNTSGVRKPLDKNDFVQNSFMLTTQWWGHPRMLKALKMNYATFL